MARRPPRRMKPRDSRRGRKTPSPLTIAKVDYVDYKDMDLIGKFVSDRAKIRGRRVNGNDARQQREVAKAVKNAREMALIPYASRVTTQRRDRRGDERAPRSEGPPARPSIPPPGGLSESVDSPDVYEEEDIPEERDRDDFSPEDSANEAADLEYEDSGAEDREVES